MEIFVDIGKFCVFFLIDFWNKINLGFLTSKFFIYFLLMYPLLIAVIYLVVYLNIKFFGYKYSNFHKIKELTIFFGFLYFFLFILLLIDFIYYIEFHKLYFNMKEDDINFFLNLVKKQK